MKCKECRERLIFYIDKELSDTDFIQIENHLNECKECEGVYKSLKSKLEIIEIEKKISPNPFLATKIEGQIEQAEKNNFFNVQRIYQPVLYSILVAFTLLAGVLIGNSYNEVLNNESFDEQAELFYFNEFDQENIELTFLSESNDE